MTGMSTLNIDEENLADTESIFGFRCPSCADHLEVGLSRAGLTRPSAQKPSRRPRAGLGLVGDVQDIAAVLDVLHRRR
jgi:hypothetical protein